MLNSHYYFILSILYSLRCLILSIASLFAFTLCDAGSAWESLNFTVEEILSFNKFESTLLVSFIRSSFSGYANIFSFYPKKLKKWIEKRNLSYYIGIHSATHPSLGVGNIDWPVLRWLISGGFGFAFCVVFFFFVFFF